MSASRGSKEPRKNRGIEEELPDKDFEDLEKSFKAAVAQAKDWLDGCPMACLDP